MRDAITSMAAFLILAVLATGVYLARDHYQRARTTTEINAPAIADIEGFVNTLLGGNPATPPPAVAMPTLPSVTASPTATPLPRAGAATPTPTPLPPPPTPQALPSPTPVATASATVRYPYTLRAQPRHDNACGKDMVAGRIQDAQGKPLAGVIVQLKGDFGVKTVQTSSNAGQKGRYAFHLSGDPQRLFIGIVDEGGNPLSPRVEILHLLPNSGYEAFHCHYVDWQYNR